MTITDTTDTSVTLRGPTIDEPICPITQVIATTIPTIDTTREELIDRIVTETGATRAAAAQFLDFWWDIADGGFADPTKRKRTLGHFEMSHIHAIMAQVMPDDTASAPGTLHRDIEHFIARQLPLTEGTVTLLHTTHNDGCGGDFDVVIP